MTRTPVFMLKKLLPIAAVFTLFCGVAACTKKAPPLPPGALTQEQKDRLKQNAIKAYEQIVKDYPDSPHAAEAKQRIDALKVPGK